MRVATASLAVLLLLGLVSMPSLPRASANPSILYVGPGQQFPTIHDAINAASAGDTIMVSSSTYYETNLVITQNGLILKGADKTSTIIDGQNSNNKIIIVQANNVVIQDFTIRNAGGQYFAYGVYLNGSANTLLENNVFSGCSFSIRAEKSTNINVTSSSFLGDSGYFGSAGVYSYSSQVGFVAGNTFSNVHVGVYLIAGSSGLTIRNNTFSSSIFLGVNVANSSQNWVIKNTFRDNNSSIEIKQSNGILNNVIGNTILRSQTAGLIIESAEDNTIHHNNFINNTQQVKFIGSPLANVWNTINFGEGNYWSDYYGTDSNMDGIDDTAKTLASGNTDFYPLIGPVTMFPVMFQASTYNVYTISNSIITKFNFDSTARQISFQVSGANGSPGTCRIVFPTVILSPPYNAYVNGVNQSTNAINNGSYTALYFSYTQSSLPSNVIVVPEFPLPTLITLLIVLPLAVALWKKKKTERSHESCLGS